MTILIIAHWGTMEEKQERRRKRWRKDISEGVPFKSDPQAHDFTADNVEDILRNEKLEPINVFSTLVWSQPATRTGRQNTSCQLFYTDNPEVGSEEEEEEKEDWRQCELHEESIDVIREVPPWTSSGPEVVRHIPDNKEADHAHRVSSTLGFEFPPVMGQYVETVVQGHWECWKRKGLIEGGRESEEKFHSVIVEAQTYLAKLITAYIRRRTSKKAMSSQKEAILDLKKAAEKALDSEVETSFLLSSAGHDSDSSSSPSDSGESDSY